jgi:hypothetical protein
LVIVQKALSPPAVAIDILQSNLAHARQLQLARQRRHEDSDDEDCPNWAEMEGSYDDTLTSLQFHLMRVRTTPSSSLSL